MGAEEVVVEVVVEEEVAEEEEAVVEAVVEAVGHPHHNKSSFLAKTKESWGSSPRYSMETEQKPKPSWKRSKDTSALILTSTDSILP